VHSGEMFYATAKADYAAPCFYTFAVKHKDGTYIYVYSTELRGQNVQVPIGFSQQAYYTVEVYFNGTRIRSAAYWLAPGGAIYLGTLGPPASLVPVSPIAPPGAPPPIYNATISPVGWQPEGLPLPEPISSNPIHLEFAAALMVAVIVAYATFSSSRNPIVGLAAAIVTFLVVAALLVPAQHRPAVTSWAAFLISAAVALLTLYLTRGSE